MIISSQFGIQFVSTYPREIWDTNHFDFTIYDSSWDCFYTIFLHLRFGIFSHFIYIINCLTTTFTLPYLNVICDMLTKWTVSREYFDCMMLLHFLHPGNLITIKSTCFIKICLGSSVLIAVAIRRT